MRKAFGSMGTAGVILLASLALVAPAHGEGLENPAALAGIEAEVLERVPDPLPDPAPEPLPELEPAPEPFPEPPHEPTHVPTHVPTAVPESEAVLASAPAPSLASAEVPDPAPEAVLASPAPAAEPAPSPGTEAVPMAVSALGFSPRNPEPGGAITVTGSGCAGGENVLIRTWIPAIGSSSYLDVFQTSASDGSFSVPSFVFGAPGDVPPPAPGAQFGVAAHCGGVITSDPERFQIVFGTLSAGNTLPVAVADAYATPYETPLHVSVPGLLGNDSDADDDRLSSHLFSDPVNGTLSNFLEDGSFTYTPDAGFSGTDSFVYYAWDGSGTSADTTVRITVESAVVPSPPVAVDDSYTTPADTPLSVAVSEGLLANDSDPDGDEMRVCLATSTFPSHGTLTYPSNDGRFTYTPDVGFTGVDTFTYHAGDRTGCGNFATVTIHVADPPPLEPPTEDPPSDPRPKASPPPASTTTALAATGAEFSVSRIVLAALVLAVVGSAMLRRSAMLRGSRVRAT